MIIVATLPKCRLVWLAVGVILFAASVPALAAIDTFTVGHVSGACGNVSFDSKHFSWDGRQRIRIASGERIAVTLYGHGADFAQDAIGSNIHEWISNRGTTTNYPNAPVMFGGTVPKGYVTVAIRARPSDGVGNRTVTVKWLTGNEALSVKIVANCNDLTSSAYRTLVPPGSSSSSGGPITGGSGSSGIFIDVAPRANMLNIFRRQSENPAFTENGVQYFSIDSQQFCNDMTGNQSKVIIVPDLRWGVTNVGTAAIGTAFAAQLRSDSEILRTEDIPGLNPGETRDFTFQRLDSRVRVFRFLTRNGCFVSPTADEFFEDPPFTVVVNTNNALTEAPANQSNNSRNY